MKFSGILLYVCEGLLTVKTIQCNDLIISPSKQIQVQSHH